MTEAEAREKWCPFTRVSDGYGVGEGRVGYPVAKIGGDYRFAGYVVAEFTKLDGKSVRFVAENGDGILHIFSAKQLGLGDEPAPPPTPDASPAEEAAVLARAARDIAKANNPEHTETLRNLLLRLADIAENNAKSPAPSPAPMAGGETTELVRMKDAHREHAETTINALAIIARENARLNYELDTIKGELAASRRRWDEAVKALRRVLHYCDTSDVREALASLQGSEA